ncbi:hypothetical protein E2C01_026864 [Portunus trituberculatus]|uniref:Uncharacterized protein n=1 Tax=Portunus trituberculatus TaxID=210409 RepID=A0A5B7EH88_PORTR|nr:hypothetical protein [Portunus trituberculatus]
MTASPFMRPTLLHVFTAFVPVSEGGLTDSSFTPRLHTHNPSPGGFTASISVLRPSRGKQSAEVAHANLAQQTQSSGSDSVALVEIKIHVVVIPFFLLFFQGVKFPISTAIVAPLPLPLPPLPRPLVSSTRPFQPRPRPRRLAEDWDICTHRRHLGFSI